MNTFPDRSASRFSLRASRTASPCIALDSASALPASTIRTLGGHPRGTPSGDTLGGHPRGTPSGDTLGREKRADSSGPPADRPPPHGPSPRVSSTPIASLTCLCRDSSATLGWRSYSTFTKRAGGTGSRRDRIDGRELVGLPE